MPSDVAEGSPKLCGLNGYHSRRSAFTVRYLFRRRQWQGFASLLKNSGPVICNGMVGRRVGVPVQ